MNGLDIREGSLNLRFGASRRGEYEPSPTEERRARQSSMTGIVTVVSPSAELRARLSMRHVNAPSVLVGNWLGMLR